jgi:hypothetical protein
MPLAAPVIAAAEPSNWKICTGHLDNYNRAAAEISASAILRGKSALVSPKDDYAHDGRVLFEVLNDNAVLRGKQGDKDVIMRLAQAYQDINAPVGLLGRKTFARIAMLEGVAFEDKTVDKLSAERLIIEADILLASVH